MPIQSSITKILSKSPGSSAVDAQRVRQLGDKVDIANAINSTQRQIDTLVSALQQEPTIQEFEVTDSSGGLIAWIGNAVIGSLSYVGAWFKQLYIGGTSAATAKIVADANGNVTINGATIVLNGNGTLTTINNAVNPWSTNAASMTSQNIATGNYSMIDPFNVGILTAANSPIVWMRNTAGVGSVSMNGAGTFGSVLVTGGGSNSHLYTTELQITNGTTRTMTLDNSTSIFSLNGPLGNTFIADDSVDTGNVITPSLNSGAIPTSGPLAANASQQLVAATAGAGITLGATSITNSGVLSNVAGTGISVSGATGNVTITNAGVTSAVAGTGISVSGATGAVTITNSAPFPGGFSGTILLIGPTTNGSITVSNGVITAAVDPT